MEINYVQEYLTLLSVGNYLDAAEEMYTSPASLARHIKKLEEDLGFELFVPQGRSLVPSELAKAFTPFAEEIVHAQERCYNFLDTYQSKKPDMLRVGTLAVEGAAYHLPDLISAFLLANPQVSVEMYEGETKELCSMLFVNKLDLVFSFLPEEYRETTVHFSVVKDHMALFVPMDYPLSSLRSVRLGKLNGMTFVPRPRHSFLSDFCNNLLRENDISYKMTFDPPSTANLLSMVASGSGISLMPKIAAEYLLGAFGKNTDIRVVDIEPEIDTSVHLLYMANHNQTQQCKNFIHFIKNM